MFSRVFHATGPHAKDAEGVREVSDASHDWPYDRDPRDRPDGVRKINEQTRLAEIYAGRGPQPGPPSSLYVIAALTEQILHHVIEQLIFVGLAFLKLGIGFSIATIVLNLRETGTRALESLEKAGVGNGPLQMRPPWFAKFPFFLVAGFAIVLFFFALTGLWVWNEISPLGDQMKWRMTLEAIIKPGKMIGTALLLLGIGSGLATIVLNLRMQARVLPKLLVGAVKRAREGSVAIPSPKELVPRGPFAPLIGGFVVVLTADVPIAALLAWNRFANLTTAGWASPAAETLDVVLEHWIESYILFGIATMLTGIGLWLLTILRSLMLQRLTFGQGLSEASGRPVPLAPSAPRPLKLIPILLGLGLGIVVLALGLTAVWIQAGVSAVATSDRAVAVADHVWEAFIKPFKFAGLAVVMLGIGVALGVIVVNLQLVAMMLPGVFAALNQIAQGKRPEPLEMKPLPFMSLFPKRLFLGIVVGVIVVVTATFPLSFPLRIGTFDTFLGANLTADLAAQAAFSLERTLEHLILPYKLLGLAVIFFAIGRFFTTIVGFVRARKAIVIEGVESVVANLRATSA